MKGQVLHLSAKVDDAVAMYSKSLVSGGPTSQNRNRMKTLEMIALIVEEMKHKELRQGYMVADSENQATWANC